MRKALRSNADIPQPQAQTFKPPGRGLEWAQKFVAWARRRDTEISTVINSGEQVQGAVPSVASAETITIQSAVTHVTGVQAISAIKVPADFGSGDLILLADGAWSLTAAGNIAKAYAPAVGQAVYLVFDRTLGRFYPHG